MKVKVKIAVFVNPNGTWYSPWTSDRNEGDQVISANPHAVKSYVVAVLDVPELEVSGVVERASLFSEEG
jgi:hypothetical protein